MATAYYFVGFSTPEHIKVVFVDRTKIFMASSLTKMKLEDVSEKFYDTMSEKLEALQLNQDEFDYKVKISFARQGYKFLEKKDE